ncbi:T9SS type A sorting domain-containing protein, partial [Flavobacterium sp.]|uniref:T9SS type A sorting domain-containing protein n=1 Tax=Flavobacterium sp. TaxID=239 RepID=UPI002EDAE651
CSNYCDGGINLGFTGCKKLKYICAEDRLNSQIQMIIYQNGISSKIEVNSYCSFVSPKDAYVIKGNSIFDNDNNGCDNDDYKFTNLDYSILNLSDVTNATTKYSGNFTIPVGNGSYQIKANIENPDFFEIFPSIVNVNFPADTSPFTQNFCVSPIGNHSDLEITILPINIARPGFDAVYKIVFKNKGNQIQSGKVNLEYYSNVLNYQSSNVAFSEKNNNTLSWLFENLKPFESREITVTLKVNSPTHSPAVQQGDLLEFTASILSDKIDEKPNDNSFLFRQTALNSYDPNDKTCLEGSVITPDLIGEYVHYMIRFENTGNYMAQNIVVKDMIDLNKFDISTLIPTSSSHSFVTKISEGNKVEFIFENIKLPFDDANNDGYIAFKIKTKPTLKVGDSFTNDANIYFDYNFPILTNEATSTFKTTLSISDFDFSKYFILYPNPSDQVLNISKTQDIEIKSFGIYDILGQLIIAVPDAKTISNIDVSRLEKGNYFIKVKSDRGNSSMKFIKI